MSVENFVRTVDIMIMIIKKINVYFYNKRTRFKNALESHCFAHETVWICNDVMHFYRSSLLKVLNSLKKCLNLVLKCPNFVSNPTFIEGVHFHGSYRHCRLCKTQSTKVYFHFDMYLNDLSKVCL